MNQRIFSLQPRNLSNQDLTIRLAKSDSLPDAYCSTLKDIEAVFDSVMPVDDEMDPGQTGSKLSTRLTNKLNEVNVLIFEKENELKVLNSRLNNSNKKVSEMFAKIEDLNSEIREKESVILNLNEDVKKLENQLEIIDTRKATTFTLDAEKKNIELITHHHPLGYDLNESGSGKYALTITDPANFWKYSKYLVITY